MKFTLRKVLVLLLTLVFVGSGGMVIVDLIQKQAAEKVYEEAAGLANIPDLPQTEAESVPEEVSPVQEEPAQEKTEEKSEPVVYVDPYADALKAMDFAALREANSDVTGWIMIPGTKISYPLVQGDTNDYYLKRNWRKNYSTVGAIFIEEQCSADLSDFNTIIYGHRMNNGSMFGSLEKYKDAAYLQAHPSIYITDDAGCHIYDIFAVYEAVVESPAYALGMEGEQEKQIVINWSLRQSEVDAGVVPMVEDRIVTLSTCTGKGYETRFVVQGVLREPVAEEPTEAPSETAEEASTEVTEEAPAETAEEASTEVTEEAPAETAEEAPAETAAEAPAETAEETPAETAAETPAEDGGEQPAE